MELILLGQNNDRIAFSELLCMNSYTSVAEVRCSRCVNYIS